jgi:hypothetical protein
MCNKDESPPTKSTAALHLFREQNEIELRPIAASQTTSTATELLSQ